LLFSETSSPYHDLRARRASKLVYYDTIQSGQAILDAEITYNSELASEGNSGPPI